MNRRALLSAILATAPAVAGCVGDNTVPRGNNDADGGDGQGDDESRVGDDSGEGEDSTYEPLCENPEHVLDEDNRVESFDYASWEIWEGIGTSSAGMSRGVSGDVDSIEWMVGETIARNNEIFEIQIDDDTLVMEPTNGGERREFDVGDELGFRHDRWEVGQMGDDTVVLELVAQPHSLKISWEDGEYLNLDGDIYVVDIEAESRIYLCRVEDIDQ